MLKAGQDFEEIRESYVIFIYKKDKFKEGLPVYHVDRYISETGKKFEDGSHIIYVNGSYKGKDEVAQLIEDFHQNNADNMHYKILANAVKHYKENEKGRESMCESVEEFAREYAKEYADKRDVINVKNLMDNLHISLEQALNALEIQGSSRTYISGQIKN